MKYSSLFVLIMIPFHILCQGITSPTITISVAKPEFNKIEWKDNTADSGETYNIYMSHNPINDLSATGVIQIDSNIPRAIEIWYHRPYSEDGAEQTFYYAMTATLNDTETPLINGVSNAGPISNFTSPYHKATYLSNFYSMFNLDGDLDEFFFMTENILPEFEWSDTTIVEWDEEDFYTNTYIIFDYQRKMIV